MKKKCNSLMIGAGVLAALCAVYAGVIMFGKHAEKREEEKAEAARIYVTDLADITELAYDNGSEQLAFIKDGDRWFYKEDRDFPLMQYYLTALEEDMGRLEAVRRLDQGDDPDQYGLEGPAGRVTAVTADGTETTVLIGDAVRGSGSDPGAMDGSDPAQYYAMKEGEDVAYTIPSALVSDIDNGLYDLIQLEEFPMIEGEHIRQLTISKDGRSRTYVKKDLDGQGNIAWYLGSSDSEDNKLADNAGPDSLADAVCQLTVSGCANYKTPMEELAGYGLTEPFATIRYAYEKEGETGEAAVRIGYKDETGEEYYAQMEGSDAVNRIPVTLIDRCLEEY